MADKDLGSGASKGSGGDDGPSLELPSFGLRRKRKARKQDPQPEAEAPTREEAHAQPQPQPEPEPRPEPEPVPEPETAPEVEPEPDDQPSEVTGAAATTAEKPNRPSRRRRLPRLPKREKEQPPAAEATRAETVTTAPADEEAEPEGSGATWEGLQLPELPGRVAAAVAGGVIGLLAVIATFGSLQLCSLVRGTSSCGGPGLLLLIALLIVMVLLGGWLLKGFRQPDPGSTSFLAVGLLAVVALLFLIDVLFSWTMIIVMPLVGAGTYVLSHWVTTNVIEPAREDPPA